MFKLISQEACVYIFIYKYSTMLLVISRLEYTLLEFI